MKNTHRAVGAYFLVRQFDETLRGHSARLDNRQGLLQLGTGVREQCREVGRHKPCGGDGMGIKRECRRPPTRLEFFVVGDDTGQMNNRRMDDEFTGVIWAQLATNSLFNLYGHAPGSNEFRTHFREVASDVGLLYLGQGGLEVARVDEGGLSPLRNGLVENKVPNVAEQTFNEKSLAVVDATGLRDLAGEQAQSTLLRQNLGTSIS